MSDMFPEPPKSTNYSSAFERCWKAHPVGTKKSAWKAGEKAAFTESNWDWLTNYLERRHKEDARWVEGIYVPHLSSIINGERWQDVYKTVKKDRYDQASDDFDYQPVSDEERAANAEKVRLMLSEVLSDGQ